MQELWNAALSAVNLPYTFLLGLVLLYWISVILGALDLSALDFDVDADVDVDMDVDLDMDVDADVDSDLDAGGGWFATALNFFNFGKVPFMIIMTVVIVSSWAMAVVSNHYWGNYDWLFALAMVGPILFVSLLLAKFLTAPLVPLFEQINKASKPIDYVGLNCRLLLPADHEKFGQAEVTIDGDSLLIHVKTAQPGLRLQTGDRAVVIGKTPDKQFYLVSHLDPHSEIHLG